MDSKQERLLRTGFQMVERVRAHGNRPVTHRMMARNPAQDRVVQGIGNRRDNGAATDSAGSAKEVGDRAQTTRVAIAGQRPTRTRVVWTR